MSEPTNKYPKRVAKTIVEQAIVFGMPVPKVESMYEYAKNGAYEAVSKTEYATEAARNAAYFTLFRRFFKAGQTSKAKEPQQPKKANNDFPTFDELNHQWRNLCTKKKTSLKLQSSR